MHQLIKKENQQCNISVHKTTIVYIITRILKGGYFTILHTLIEISSAKKNRQWFAFSSKFGGRPKLEEREVTPMHFSHLKIQHNWFSVKYCKEVHLLTPMLSIFDVDMHLEQREDTLHLFWILICVDSQSKEGFVQALGFFSTAIGKKWKTTNPTIILRPLNYILCFLSTSLKQ